MEIPKKAFALEGYSGKIELFITEVIGIPNERSFNNGYDIRGRLIIETGCYKVDYDNYYFSTKTLHKFLVELEKCYETLSGSAQYIDDYEQDLIINLEMKTSGHAEVTGSFQANLALHNKLKFEMETDQSYFVFTILDIRNVMEVFT